MNTFAAMEILPKIEATVFASALVAGWALMRPTMVRDYDNRRLPPNPTARFIFVVVCLIAYLALVIGFHSFRDVTARLASGMPLVSNLLESFKDQAPLLAVVTLGGLLQLSIFKDLERGLLAWLHSAGYLHQDGLQLSGHLQDCAFLPTEDERRKNRDLARKFGVYVTGELDDVGLVTFASWRKVASLLRQLRDWNPEEGRTLSQKDMKTLADLETAHERKTQLAMTIVKLVEQAEKGGTSGKSLSELLVLLSTTPHMDREGIVAVESKVRGMLASANAKADQPLRLTGEEFRTYLAQIEGYFQVEYEILLQQASSLAARSVVLSGEAAPDRLERLRGLGFGGLGYIEPINFDRILWLFLIVAVGGFLVMFLGTSLTSTDSAPSTEILARFALIMASAALAGAMVGSKRTLSRATRTPWGAYFVAGVLAVLLHIGIHAILDLIKGYLSADPAAMAAVPVARRMPWSSLPFFLAIAVCRLARLERWPLIGGRGSASSLLERLADGLTVSAILLLAFYLAIAAHLAFGLPLPARLQESWTSGGIFAIGFSLPLLAFGFLIGFFVVRDVRRAAHASIIDISAPPAGGELARPVPAALPAAA